MLYDLLQNESTKQFVRETAWSQGIEQLLVTSYLAEPVATAFIFKTVTEDAVLRGQIMTILGVENTQKVISASGIN